MNELVALDLPGGPAFVAAMQKVWDRGDAVFPLDARLPEAARARSLAAMAPARIVDGGGERPLVGGRPVEPGDALVMATSGTSGESKGVVLTHAAVAASAEATSRRLAVDPQRDHWLACLPLAHVGGMAVVARALHTGTRLTVLPGFDAGEVRAAGASLVSLVPTLLARVDAASFRTIVLGGSRPPADPPDNAVITYGMTETGSGCVYDGVPLDGVDVDVTPDGEIRLRAPLLLRAYRDGRDAHDAEGWFPTGDLGEWDGTRLVVHGRRAELIITGGENVWPEPVEAVLGTHPEVADVAVGSQPDPEWGERVVAYVVPRDPSDPPALAALRDHVKATLPAWCAPRQVVYVEKIPRSPLGKVQRAVFVQKPAI
jgi:O-succinylbenzoic acid--CoA ligase